MKHVIKDSECRTLKIGHANFGRNEVVLLPKKRGKLLHGQLSSQNFRGKLLVITGVAIKVRKFCIH